MNSIEKGIETVASEVMGAVKATKGKVAGLTGVFEHLAREHGKVTGLLLRLKASADPKLRAELFPKIRIELLSHERGELAEVFPVFHDHTELAGFVEEHRRDAGKLDGLIADLDKTSPADPMWSPRLADLIKSVGQHATEEENDFFPKASRVLGPRKSEALLKRFEAAKTRIAKTIGPSAKSAAKAPAKHQKARAITARPQAAAHRMARKTTAKAGPAKTAKRAGAASRKTGKGRGGRARGTARP